MSSADKSKLLPLWETRNISKARGISLRLKFTAPAAAGKHWAMAPVMDGLVCSGHDSPKVIFAAEPALFSDVNSLLGLIFILVTPIGHHAFPVHHETLEKFA